MTTREAMKKLTERVRGLQAAGGASGDWGTRQVAYAAEALVEAAHDEEAALQRQADRPAVARGTDPATSHQAAASASARHTRQQVLQVLRVEGRSAAASAFGELGLTDEQLCDKLPGCSRSGVRSRRADLVRAGLVAATHYTGTTSKGRQCKRWRATTVTERMEGKDEA